MEADRPFRPATVSTTLNVYTHMFDHAEHAATVMERLEGRFGETLRPADPEAPAGQEAAFGVIRRFGQLA